MNISLPRDNNRITVLGGTSNVDGSTPVAIYADPTTHRLLVDATQSGTKEVMQASLSSTQLSNLAQTNHVEFNTILFQQGTGITLATGSGQANGIFTLPAGKTFRITSSLFGTTSATTSEIIFSCYNNTGSAYFGATAVFIPSTFAAANVSTFLPAEGYITTVASTSIELRIIYNSTNQLSQINGGAVGTTAEITRISIEEI